MNKPANKPARPAAKVPRTERKTSRKSTLQELAHNLTERVKELNCLYGISRLFENGTLSIDEILERVVELLPPAWQYPEITCARINVVGKQFKTYNFRETARAQSQNIFVEGHKFGTVEIYYLKEMAESYEGPFLKEERNLLQVIAERLGHAIEQKNAEDNLKTLYQRERELYEKLQAEMQWRVDLTRKLIHELKTPLTTLVATSQMLYDRTLDKKTGKLASYVLDSANNLNNRIEELHDVIRGETGTLKLTRKPVNLERLLKSMVEESRPLSRTCGIEIELKIKGRLPIVSADPERVRQIMLNLINNACKYASEGKRLTIMASAVNGEVLIEVQDYGPGIYKDRLKTLFEPGYQLQHHEEQVGGLGIGLALCKTLVELQGGRIWVKSKASKGSGFFFTLPAARPQKN
jgi:signal transduction histidine kinase